jgi:hypothetical protein
VLKPLQPQMLIQDDPAHARSYNSNFSDEQFTRLRTRPNHEHQGISFSNPWQGTQSEQVIKQPQHSIGKHSRNAPSLSRSRSRKSTKAKLSQSSSVQNLSHRDLIQRFKHLSITP